MRGSTSTAISFFLISCTCLLSCAQAPPAAVISPATFSVRGEVITEGSNPFEREIRLRCTNGEVWTVHPSGPAGELVRLKGHTVEVSGAGTDKNDKEMTIRIERYRLLAVSGFPSFSGTVVQEGDIPLLQLDGDGGSLSLKGPLAGALLNFEGFRVWIWGDVLQNSQDRILDVKGYEVIGSSY